MRTSPTTPMLAERPRLACRLATDAPRVRLAQRVASRRGCPPSWRVTRRTRRTREGFLVSAGSGGTTTSPWETTRRATKRCVFLGRAQEQQRDGKLILVHSRAQEMPIEQLSDIRADSIAQWIEDPRARRTIMREFKSFLMTYTDADGVSIYGQRIRQLGEGVWSLRSGLKRVSADFGRASQSTPRVSRSPSSTSPILRPSFHTSSPTRPLPCFPSLTKSPST